MTTNTLDVSEQTARIDRMVQETHKLVAEQAKLLAEQTKMLAEERKLAAEQRKLTAEGDKLIRDHRLAPAALILGAVGGAAGLVVALTSLLSKLGVF